MDREHFFINRYIRNVSTQRLVFYGIVLLSVIVIIILLLTLTGGDISASPAQEKPAGHTALEKVPLVDGHNNLPVPLMQKLLGVVSSFSFDSNLVEEKNYSWIETDLPSLKTGLVGTQVWTAKAACTSQYKDAIGKTIQQLDAITRLIDKYKNILTLITSPKDIEKVFNEKKIGSILALEGGLSMDNKLATLRLWSKMGIRIMSLTSECSTPWAESYADTTNTSLTNFGKIVIKEMNRLGMIIDLTGSSEATQKQVLELSKAPCIFSSVAAYALSSNERNIKETLFDTIKKNKALIMISLDSNLLVNKAAGKSAQIGDVVTQISYWREKVGVDHIGLGSGFNSDDRLAVKGLENSSTFPSLFDQLAKISSENETSWTINELQKLAGLNFIRVFEEVEKVRSESTESPYENRIAKSDVDQLNGSECYT